MQLSILLALARYRYLTCSQVVLMELGSLSAVRRAMRVLSAIRFPSPILLRRTFPPSARLGRIEHMYSLSAYGIIFLTEQLPGYATSRSLAPTWEVFKLDYEHRKLTVTSRILLEKALRGQDEYDLLTWANYFEKSDEVYGEPVQPRRKAATEVTLASGKRCIPDGVFELSDPQQRGLYVVEVELSRKSSRVLSKVHQHQQALADGTFSRVFGLDEDYHAVFLLQHQTTLKRLLERLEKSSSFTPFRQHMLFTTLAALEIRPLTCWLRVGSSEPVHLVTGKTVSDR
ncbi:hypothetical protein [Acanthopleuribacter pedis]|uniref:Uncharacterized protein n=1 Tax=Acanthopleuribacter pedis TaxID=442870 RepID=A0A8J7QGT2_9BACT|nr:hypothetical protein [Acanthopleuribacter pedis]MBO1318310.1 hypothetical protein [Acanthopleuribacter pedis]